ncbi:MAG: DNA topoisomerase III [Spirochaetales bacterium]|nr:DNA topoisomerase III [Spirochaetales bacterium]
MKAILAEKPSVAREIARIAGATKGHDGYLEGNGYVVTWALGHLIGLAKPEEYGNFQKENLPMLPAEFILTPRTIKAGKSYQFDKRALQQLEIIESVFTRCNHIIVATDAGREGELIFRYIYNYLGCKKTFSRLWISSLTEKAIRQGLNNLKNGHDYDNLYRAAQARSESDWLVGMNATQAITLNAGHGLYSLGRVQTPTLGMVCKRFLENKKFVSKPFWVVEAELKKDSLVVKAPVTTEFENEEKATQDLQVIRDSGLLKVATVETKQRTEKPPLLYDLTALQKDANSRLGFSATQTLSVAQKLYEDKLITYPRTGSRFIPRDVFEEIPALISTLHQHPVLGDYAKKLNPLNDQCVNDGKVTDHHALLITENKPTGLKKEEQAVYDMIAGRMLEAFSPNCQKEITQVVFNCNGIELKANGTVTTTKGWRAVLDIREENETALPEFSEGEQLPITRAEILKKRTRPKPLLTEAALLSAMENAGKELDNEDYRKILNAVGIGTPATRAAVIETLFAREYIKRNGKSLVPTEKGLAVYAVVKDMKIADVEMTGNWEYDLARIEQGAIDAGTFLRGIRQYTTQITEELLQSKIRIEINDTPGIVCPKCKKGNVFFYSKVAKCDHTECGLVIFRNICGKILTDAQIGQLLSNGKTSEIKGFKSNKGNTFNAILVLKEDFKTGFEFVPDKLSLNTRSDTCK